MPKGMLLTVGTSSDSEIFCVRKEKPDYVAFICTRGSRRHIDTIQGETGLTASQLQIYEVRDSANEVGALVRKCHEACTWLRDQCGARAALVINPTAGRKWMSMGASLYASRTNARQVYVDVSYPGGKLDPTTMKLVRVGRAHDHLAFFDVDDAVNRFNRHDFNGAGAAFRALKPSGSAETKLYHSLATLCGHLDAWDRFLHYSGGKRGVADKADEALDRAAACAGELHLWRRVRFVSDMKRLLKAIRKVEQAEKPSLLATADLLANALRRIHHTQFEDAAARTYRALESVSQYLLLKHAEIRTGEFKAERLHAAAQEQFRNMFRRPVAELSGKLGLVHGYQVLASAVPQEGERFFDRAGEFRYSKHLQFRNESILAHGWQCVSEDNAKKFAADLVKDLKALGADAGQFEIPEMPRLWT